MRYLNRAYEGGVNYFDTAEIYGFGNAEIAMGKALKRLGLARKDYVLSTKFFKVGTGVNDAFLSRKHIIEGVNNSLKRLQLDYMDIAFAHRYDYITPIEETCRAFNRIIEDGKAFYWATSQWTPQQVMEAFECCERLNLIKPIADQSQYNLFVRERFEVDMVPLFAKYGYGNTIWSPLAGGFLTGKYNTGAVPADARYHGEKLGQQMNEAIVSSYVGGDEAKFHKRLVGLGEIAKEVGCTQAQLSLAWCLANKDVSTALVGASKPAQFAENLKAVEVLQRWTPEIEKKIEDLMGNRPAPPLNWRTWQPMPHRRDVNVEFAAKKA